jgi:pimeloyl-ACP methyl ester carboxylesterase
MGTMTLEGGRRLAYEIAGAGSPTIVLIGYVRGHFSSVVPQLAAFGSVLSYDRGGYGESELEQHEPDALSCRVRELKNLVDALDLPVPYVLVGFSIGALIAQLYAVDHPDNVKGLVSIDGDDGIPADLPEWPAFPDHVEAEALAKLLKNVPPDLARTTMPPPPESLPAIAADGVDRQPAFDRLAALRERDVLPDIPFVHLGATGHYFGPEEMLPISAHAIRERLVEKHARTSSAYRQGVFIEADTGHYIQFDRPDLVVDAVARIVRPTAATD